MKTATTSTTSTSPARRRARLLLAGAALTVAPFLATSIAEAAPATPGSLSNGIQTTHGKKDQSWKVDCVEIKGPFASWRDIEDCRQNTLTLCNVDGGKLEEKSYGQYTCKR